MNPTATIKTLTLPFQVPLISKCGLEGSLVPKSSVLPI